MDSSSVSTRWVWQAIFPTWKTWWPESLEKYPTTCLSIERILRKELRCEAPVALSPNWNTNKLGNIFLCLNGYGVVIGCITCKKPPKTNNYCVWHAWTGNQLLPGMKIQGMLFSEQQGLWSVVMEVGKDSAICYPSSLEAGKILVLTHQGTPRRYDKLIKHQATKVYCILMFWFLFWF